MMVSRLKTLNEMNGVLTRWTCWYPFNHRSQATLGLVWWVCRVLLEGVAASCGLGRRQRRHWEEKLRLCSLNIAKRLKKKNPYNELVVDLMKSWWLIGELCHSRPKFSGVVRGTVEAGRWHDGPHHHHHDDNNGGRGRERETMNEHLGKKWDYGEIELREKAKRGDNRPE
jgi:hypothetical protein